MLKNKNLIIKDNALINASYNLELIEQRLILLAIAQARKVGDSLSSDRKVVLNVSEYIDVYKIKGRSAYENIKKACATLFDRQFTYVEREEKGMRIAKSRWVSEIAYNDDKATVDFTFAPSVIPLIHVLEKHFTSYELEKVSDLKSKYSIRLYEVLIAWRSQGKTPLISVADIRYRLGIMDHEYQAISDLKKWTIDLAIREINEKTDIKVSYEQHKAGRKISGFVFFLQIVKLRHQQMSTVLPEIPLLEGNGVVHDVFQDMRMNAITPQQQRAYLATLSLEKISATLKRANRKADEKLAHSGDAMINYGGWYATAFKNNWGDEELGEQMARAKNQTQREQAIHNKQAKQQCRQQEKETQAALVKQAIEELVEIWKRLSMVQRLHLVHHLPKATTFNILCQKEFVAWIEQGDKHLAAQIEMIEDNRFKAMFAKLLPLAKELFLTESNTTRHWQLDLQPENMGEQLNYWIRKYHDLTELDKRMVWDLVRDNLNASGKITLINHLDNILSYGQEPYCAKIFQSVFIEVMNLID